MKHLKFLRDNNLNREDINIIWVDDYHPDCKAALEKLKALPILVPLSDTNHGKKPISDDYLACLPGLLNHYEDNKDFLRSTFNKIEVSKNSITNETANSLDRVYKQVIIQAPHCDISDREITLKKIFKDNFNAMLGVRAERLFTEIKEIKNSYELCQFYNRFPLEESSLKLHRGAIGIFIKRGNTDRWQEATELLQKQAITIVKKELNQSKSLPEDYDNYKPIYELILKDNKGYLNEYKKLLAGAEQRDDVSNIVRGPRP